MSERSATRRRGTPSADLDRLDAEARVTLDALEVRPLSARSLLLSFLLGTHPPEVSAARLVAFGELFGQRPGTVRTALSRMVGAGEVTTADGRYRLAGRLLDRQRELDAGQHVATDAWDGAWWTVIVTADARTSTERRHFRSSVIGARLGELRPDLWMRPANVTLRADLDGAIATRGTLDVGDADDLVARLWDTATIETTSARLLALLEPLGELLASVGDDPTDRAASGPPGDAGLDPDVLLPLVFDVSTACVRHLRTEPQLPSELVDMPVSRQLRTTYRDINERFRAMLDQHLRDITHPSPTDER